MFAKQFDLTMSSISPVSPLSPVSPMSPAKPPAKPLHLVLNQYSSSLSGMEIAVPSPLTPRFNDYRASSSQALPPIPGKASPPYYSSHSAPTSRKGSYIYNNPEDERPGTPMTPSTSSTSYTNFKEERLRIPRTALQDEVLSSNTLLVPPHTRSSTSKIPNKVLSRPELKRNPQIRRVSDFADQGQPSGRSISSERKVPTYEYSDDEYSSSLLTSQKASRQGSWAPSERTQSAEERAKDYASLLPTFVPEEYPPESGFLPSEMSARITDVFDESPMTAPLLLSRNSEDRKLSSQFSSSDSDSGSLLDESKPSLKSRAKKAFNSRKVSQEKKDKRHSDLKVLQHSQAGELTAANLAKFQNGIDEMYSTLTGFYSPSKSKTRHDSPHSRDNLHRPTTPLTADGKSGRKAWDSLKSPRSAAPKRDESVGKKLTSVLQNGAMAVGFDRGKEQKMKNEE